MSFLRQQRTQPGYDPNQRHVLHGLDADLIMLGLALHEPHFFVLREEVLFGRKEREKREADELRKATEAVTGVTDGVLAPADRWVYNKNLQILQISTLREYLRAEFRVCEAVLSATTLSASWTILFSCASLSVRLRRDRAVPSAQHLA